MADLDTLDVARELAYAGGYAQALTLAAERVDELDAIWRPVPRRSYAEQVADRAAALAGHTTPPTLRYDDADWPPVAVPGGGGVRIGPGSLVAPEVAA